MFHSFSDTSTRKSVLLTNFIIGSIMNILVIFSCPLTRYGDNKKNDLKWIGALFGVFFQFFIIMFVFGIVFCCQGDSAKGIPMLIIGLVLGFCTMFLFIRKYNRIVETEQTLVMQYVKNYKKHNLIPFINTELAILGTYLPRIDKNILAERLLQFIFSNDCSNNIDYTEKDVKTMQDIVKKYIENKKSGK